MKRGVYPGSFDPVTLGHEDLMRRSLAFVDEVVVAVTTNVSKAPLFELEERMGLLEAVVADEPRITVRPFDGLLVDFAGAVGASVIVRGLRAVSDFEYEFQMALMNRRLAGDLETVFLTPALEFTYLSSSIAREVAKFGGDLTGLVDPRVQAALQRKFRGGAA